MPHDVFISYSSHDKAVADATCAALEAQRIRCWIAPRDAIAGIEYGEFIVNAIGVCKVVVLIFSAHANDSPQVRREVERAVSKGKIVVPFRIEDVLPSNAMEYFVSTCHWLDAISPPVQTHIDHLAKTIDLLLSRLSQQPNSISPAAGARDSTEAVAPPRSLEETIAKLDPQDIVFQEIEIKLSDTWDAFLAWLASESGNMQFESIKEDADCEEPSFCHSGKPGHLTYRLVVTLKGQALTHKRKIDVIQEWLHPSVLNLEPTRKYMAWDTSLWPVEKANKDSSKIARPSRSRLPRRIVLGAIRQAPIDVLAVCKAN